MCTISINVEPGNTGSNDEKVLTAILNLQSIIMAAIDDLKTQVTNLQTQVTDLQSALDAEQTQIQGLLDTNAAVVTGLNAQIATLQEQLANGATAEQIAEIASSLTAISGNIATTKADLEGTVQDTTTPAPEA